MVTAELQTGNDRTPITPTGADAEKVSLEPDESYDTVQCSEVKEPGTHLSVGVTPFFECLFLARTRLTVFPAFMQVGM